MFQASAFRYGLLAAYPKSANVPSLQATSCKDLPDTKGLLHRRHCALRTLMAEARAPLAGATCRHTRDDLRNPVGSRTGVSDHRCRTPCLLEGVLHPPLPQQGGVDLHHDSGRSVAEIDGEEFEVASGHFMGFPTPCVAHDLPSVFTERVAIPSNGPPNTPMTSTDPSADTTTLRRIV